MFPALPTLGAVAAALLAVVAPPAAAQREVAAPADPWVHAATGAAFPTKVGDFIRGRVVEYSEDGRDASAGYQLKRGDQWLSVTFYVYPMWKTGTCDDVFADVKANIARYKGAAVVAEGREPAPSGRGGPAARYVRYTLPAGAMREDLPAVRSDAYLHCAPGGEWLVKYRASGNADFDFKPEVDRLLHAIRWPAKLAS
jgi:hypothetical protein